MVTNFIKGDEPPMLLVYSGDDEMVYKRNLTYLKKGIEDNGGQVKSIIYEKGGHTGVVSAFSWINPAGLPVEEDVNEFFKLHLKKEH